jgi:type IV fimbrial biogenesis protein FimT
MSRSRGDGGPFVRRSSQAGYSIIELVITVGLILLVTTFAFPQFVSYYQGARVRAAAQTVSAVLNAARQQAIKNNQTQVAVCITSTTITLRQSNCSGAIITVPGLTSASSNIPVPDGIALTQTATVTFANLGNATSGATYTVRDTASNRTLSVVVATSGRITIGP